MSGTPRKSHFEDPFIFHALRSWALGRDPYREALNFLSKPEKVSKLVESVVANHLVRLLFSYNPSTLFDYSNQLFYWEGPSSRQLDFAVRLVNKYLPVDVKYQNRISSDDAKPVIDFQKAGKIYRWAHTHEGYSCHEKLTSRSSCSPRASAYLEFAGKGSIPATAFSSPFRKLLSGAGQGGICVRDVVTLGSGFRLSIRDS